MELDTACFSPQAALPLTRMLFLYRDCAILRMEGGQMAATGVLLTEWM